MRYITLLFMTLGTVFCADLPREAQRELDSFNAAVAKADAIRQTAVNAAVDKAVKALNTVAKNADTAEERRAIDDEIFALKKMRVEPDLLGGGGNPVARMVGTWQRLDSWGFSYKFNADGTGFSFRGTPASRVCAFTWTQKGDTVSWSEGPHAMKSTFEGGSITGSSSKGETWSWKRLADIEEAK